MAVIRSSAAFGIFVSVALCQMPQTLSIQGISATSAALSASDIGKIPQQTIKTTDHGTPVTFGGVLLADVLAKVCTPAGEPFNKTVASYYLVAEAHDGYKAAFSWAEVIRPSRIARGTS